MSYLIRFVFAFTISIFSSESFAQVTKPYDRTRWFDSNSVTTCLLYTSDAADE